VRSAPFAPVGEAVLFSNTSSVSVTVTVLVNDAVAAASIGALGPMEPLATTAMLAALVSLASAGSSGAARFALCALGGLVPPWPWQSLHLGLPRLDQTQDAGQFRGLAAAVSVCFFASVAATFDVTVAVAVAVAIVVAIAVAVAVAERGCTGRSVPAYLAGGSGWKVGSMGTQSAHIDHGLGRGL
jgi:hypothetical protein